MASTTDKFSEFACEVEKDLSVQAKSVWAKSGGISEWLPLSQHMLDSASMAESLLEHWLSDQVWVRWLEEGLSEECLRSLVVFLVAAHDVGKAAPAFVAQHETLANRARAAGLRCRPMAELREDRKALPHSLIGEYSLKKWLRDRGIPEKQAVALSSVIGAHHGRPVKAADRVQARRRPNGTGDSAWDQVRNELLDWLAKRSGFDEVLRRGELGQISLPTLVGISGLVIVADWLASNTRLFPLFSTDETNAVDQGKRALFGWEEIALPSPWQPGEPPEDPVEAYQSRFEWAKAVVPRAMQLAVHKAAQSVDVGMLFVETSTGEGKTECAAMAAELIAARRGSQGILIALPTQATTNAMFDRIAKWIENLPQPPLDVAAWALTLGHGKAHLNETYSQMIQQFRDSEPDLPDYTEQGHVFEQDDDGVSFELCNAVVHSWFLGAKRRLLANFTIVTIDQLLMLALQRKHLMLAHLALAGKIVIIDEAHASDGYMNVYLDSALSWLGAYQVPVILLSATLTAERRRELMLAYNPQRADEINRLEFDPRQYPLLTVVPRGSGDIEVHPVKASTTSRRVSFGWSSPEVENVVSLVLAHSTEGCVLVVRNTVKDAQQTAEALKAAGVNDVTLNHAGFISADRVLKDLDLLERFGKSAKHRPRQAVVVATQVVEQSLDIDFDLLITDLAPLDLVLQRIGRLHRHHRPRPSGMESPHVVLLAELENGLPQASKGSQVVYGQHLLLRTAAVLSSHGNTIMVPDDVGPLMEAVFGHDPVGEVGWQETMKEAAAKAEELRLRQLEKARTWCVRRWEGEGDSRRDLGRWLETSFDYNEIQMGATVRDTEPSLEVIVVPTTPNGDTAIRPPWFTDSAKGFDVLDTSAMPDEDLAREIASWSVRLPGRVTRWRIEQVIEAIDSIPETRRWVWRKHPYLRGELLLPMRQESERSNTLIATIEGVDCRLRYSPETGFEVT